MIQLPEIYLLIVIVIIVTIPLLTASWILIQRRRLQQELTFNYAKFKDIVDSYVEDMELFTLELTEYLENTALKMNKWADIRCNPPKIVVLDAETQDPLLTDTVSQTDHIVLDLGM